MGVLRAPVKTDLRSTALAGMRDKQAAKIKQLRQCLLSAGFLTLDQQAAALGLARSTAWVVLKGDHKGSGLSAKLIQRMLRAPQLPQVAAVVLHEYIEEKHAGAYGHKPSRLRTFRSKMKSAISHDEIAEEV